jgi:hypothetical protein
MKTIDLQVGPKDSVIEELHGHKRSIAREHGDDIAALLRDLMDRQAQDVRVVTSIKGEQEKECR